MENLPREIIVLFSPTETEISLPPAFRPQKIVGVWAEPDGGDRLCTRGQYSPAFGMGRIFLG